MPAARRPLVRLAFAVAAGLGPATAPLAEEATGRVLMVGPKHPYTAPSQAAAVATAGDTIRIAAGEYADCAVWRAPNLTIEGVGGFAHVRDRSCQGKGIWVFYGQPVAISGVRLSGAQVPDRNGAGIRWEGGGSLILNNVWVHNNQMGVLTHNERSSSLTIVNSRFEANGDCPDFCGHGVYAGFIGRLIIRQSTFLGHRFGHHIKSRALHTEIVGNRILDEAAGTASFAIDLPDSGSAVIRHNFIHKGPKAANVKGVIAIGEESAKNASRGIVVEANTIRNENPHPTIFVWNRGPHPVTLRNNAFTGPGKPLLGVGAPPR
jgi:hypothetical protein